MRTAAVGGFRRHLVDVVRGVTNADVVGCSFCARTVKDGGLLADRLEFAGAEASDALGLHRFGQPAPS